MKNFYPENTPWDLIGKLITGESDEKDHELYQLWLSQNPEYHNLLDELRQIYLQKEQRKQSDDSIQKELAWKSIESKIKASSSQKIKIMPLKWLAVAASLLLIISIWYLSGNTNQEQVWVADQKFQTQQEGNKTLILPDGSTVILNKNSDLSWTKDFKQRRVRLKGEAFFYVMHKSDNPFIVETETGEVEVLGTQFNVSTEKGMRVFVSQGKVRMKTLAGTIDLSTQMSAFAQSKKDSPQRYFDLNAIAWKTKVLNFQNTKVSEVVATLESFYGIRIVVQNPQLLSCEFNGTFDHVEAEFILQALKFSFDANLKFSDNTFTLEGGNGCNY